MNSRLLSIIRKEFIQILRDPRTLVMIIVIPIMRQRAQRPGGSWGQSHAAGRRHAGL